MADLFGSVLSTATGTAASTSSSQALVDAFKLSKKPSVDTLSKRKSTLESNRSFYSGLKSRIDSLTSQIDKFSASTAQSSFKAKSVTSSNTAVATVTADGTATIGINTIKVNQLANNDILVGKQLAIGSSDLFSPTGTDMTFKVNSKDVKVTIAAGATNEQAMQAIAKAINGVTDINVTASYIKDTATTGRLTLTSSKTGSDNKVTFNDNSSGVLNALGFDNVDSSATNRTQAVSGNAQAYYKTTAVDNLNAKAEINGIQITRGTNSISDVIAGVTLNLLKPQDAAEQSLTLTTGIDTTAVTSLINPILTAYNDTLKYVKSNTNLSRNDPAINSLYSTLRSLSSQEITSVTLGDPKFLSEVGIKAGTDGTLSISDSTKLTDLLKDDPNKVANLFTGTDGFAQKINGMVTRLTGDTGIIKSKTTSLNSQIDYAGKRIDKLNASIESQAQAYRKQYESMLSSYMKAQSQYTSLGTYTTTTA